MGVLGCTRVLLAHRWMQPLLSRYSMPAAASPTICSRVFIRRRAPSVRRKVRKSPPGDLVGEALLNFLQRGRPSRAEVPHPWRAAPGLTLHKLHDNIDGLLLGADANETHDVGVAVLLQDPGGHCHLGSHLGGLHIPSQPQGTPGNQREEGKRATEETSLASEARRPGCVTSGRSLSLDPSVLVVVGQSARIT